MSNKKKKTVKQRIEALANEGVDVILDVSARVEDRSGDEVVSNLRPRCGEDLNAFQERVVRIAELANPTSAAERRAQAKAAEEEEEDYFGF